MTEIIMGGLFVLGVLLGWALTRRYYLGVLELRRIELDAMHSRVNDLHTEWVKAVSDKRRAELAASGPTRVRIHPPASGQAAPSQPAGQPYNDLPLWASHDVGQPRAYNGSSDSGYSGGSSDGGGSDGSYGGTD